MLGRLAHRRTGRRMELPVISWFGLESDAADWQAAISSSSMVCPF
jgi:hypothetical protein